MSSKELTARQEELLKLLYDRSRRKMVYTVRIKQEELARELGVSRQALNILLKRLKHKGFIRTGRGFIDLTEKALTALEEGGSEAFIALKIEPQHRQEVYELVKKLPVITSYRITGDIDLLIRVKQRKVDKVLRKITENPGIKETKTYVIIEEITRE